MKLAEIISNLHQPVPSNLISHKTIKGNRLEYISWFDLGDLLDARCGLASWSWEVRDIQQVGNRLTLVGCLTIYGEDRELRMMATGSEDIDTTSYGDPSSNAEAMCFKRAASKLGLARELWRKDNKSSLPNLPPPSKNGWMSADQFVAMKQKKQQEVSDYDIDDDRPIYDLT